MYKGKNPGLSLPPAVAPDISAASPTTHLQLPGKGSKHSLANIDTGTGEESVNQNE